MLSIQKAKIDQLDAIISLYRACGKEMLSKGFDNWGDFYPTIAIVETDIQEEQLFCLLEGNLLVGVIGLDENQPAPFATVRWQYPSSKTLVVHRLAIAVDQQRKGYAQHLMKFTEEYAKKHQYEAIRLDAYSINKKLLKFYEQLGYQSAKEAIYLGAKWEHPFICFEKAIPIL